MTVNLRKALPIMGLATIIIGSGFWPHATLADGYYACPLARLPPKTLSIVQQTLHDFGFDPGPINGKYTDKTLEALADYQKARGSYLESDTIMVTDLLTEKFGEKKAAKLLPKPPPALAKQHNGLDCIW